jgi:outer membrane protein OmpU
MLAGTAGFAAAEVAVSGYAEMGILTVTGENDVSNTTFHQDVEVTFSMSGETDGGLSFGTSIDLDETNVPTFGTGGTAVYVSGAFGKMTMGDTDGALDWAVQDAGSLTSMGDDHTTHIAYFSANGLDGSGDGQIVRYEYSMGDFGVALSYEQANNGLDTPSDDNVGIGATYSMDMGGTAVKIGLGYQTGTLSREVADDLATNGIDETRGAVLADVVGFSVGADLASGFSAVVGYTSTSIDGAPDSITRTGLGLTYTTGPLAVTMNYGVVDAGAIEGNTDSYGLAANYDLGGGAVVMVGYGSDTRGAPGNQSQWSAGLGLSF